jgi:hypothetical protein
MPLANKAAASHVWLRMIALPEPDRHDPVKRADTATSMCDLRAALCIANGIPQGEIDPAGGYDLTRAAYERVRQSWRNVAEGRGLDPDCERPAYDRAVAYWAARQPEFTDGDDWLAGVLKPETEI